MAREKRTEVKRLSIDLDMTDVQQRRLWEHWLVLSKRGEAARWVRATLSEAIPVGRENGGKV